MKYSRYKFISVICILMLLGSSCKKYEEGPAFSLRSKTQRVVNEWRTDRLITNGVTTVVNPTLSEYYWKFTRKGEFTFRSGLLNMGSETNGSWEFSSDKDQIIMNYSTGADTVTIIRLKEKELWLHIKFGGEETEHHLIPNS